KVFWYFFRKWKITGLPVIADLLAVHWISFHSCRNRMDSRLTWIPCLGIGRSVEMSRIGYERRGGRKIRTQSGIPMVGRGRPLGGLKFLDRIPVVGSSSTYDTSLAAPNSRKRRRARSGGNQTRRPHRDVKNRLLRCIIVIIISSSIYPTDPSHLPPTKPQHDGRHIPLRTGPSMPRRPVPRLCAVPLGTRQRRPIVAPSHGHRRPQRRDHHHQRAQGVELRCVGGTVLRDEQRSR
ncbi:hypothetical protein ACHAWX_002554, partial [Stephanocyclus meneghinianus]